MEGVTKDYVRLFVTYFIVTLLYNETRLSGGASETSTISRSSVLLLVHPLPFPHAPDELATAKKTKRMMSIRLYFLHLAPSPLTYAEVTNCALSPLHVYLFII
jgi:hypothetical protein